MGVVVARVAGARGWWVLGRAVSVMMSTRGVLQRAQEMTVMWVLEARRRELVSRTTLLGRRREWMVGMRVTEWAVWDGGYD